MRVSNRKLGGVVVGSVDQGLDVHRPPVVDARGKVEWNHDRELASAIVERGAQRPVVSDRLDQIEILRRLKPLEQILARLAAFLIEREHLDVLAVEIDAVAKRRHQHQRHQQDDQQTA